MVRGSTGGGGGGQRAYDKIRFTESTCRELERTAAEYFDWCAVLKTCVGDLSIDQSVEPPIQRRYDRDRFDWEWNLRGDDRRTTIDDSGEEE